jgi:pyrimidine-nucleoside phosphorylase
MTPVKMIIDKKREGKSLGTAEIRDFINGFVSGEIPDYQMSALAMAICCRGMTERETSDLIEVMMNSGRCLKWNFPTADKHSTGGVGDKLSFLVQPIVAACGIAVPSLTGRGLGITGGTADKLESIPGYNASLSLEEFEKVVSKIGLSMTVQTSEITPADKKLYALRDVTGTVASIPLITASILSKKLAEGADVLVFDVKCGKGAFMKTPEEANSLAESLVVHARRAGRKCAAIVTDMNAPLGYAVGNANEIVEAFVALGSDRFGTNRKVPRDVVDTSLKLASAMVSLSLEIDESAALEMCKEKLASGAALKKFEEMIAAQGGSLERFDRLLKTPTFKFKIQAMRSGVVEAIDAEKVARVALQLGAGREKAADRIDPLAGVTLEVSVGDRVVVGDPLAILESSTSNKMERLAADLLDAFRIKK